VVLSAVALVLVRQARVDAALGLGGDLLLEGEVEQARAVFETLRNDVFGGARARAGLAVCGALGAAAGDVPGYAASDARSFQLPLLLEGALARRAFEAARRLAELAGRSGEPLAPLYLAAALVEQGREAEAQALVSETPALFAWRKLGRRVTQALELQAGGRATTIVRDRSGILAGTLDAAGVFQPDAQLAEWIPGTTAEALATQLAAADAGGLRLSLDFELSRLASSSLGRHRGTIVLLDPRDGSLLAAVSDLRARRRHATPAFEQRREPASIAKLITTTAALRAGLDPDAEIARLTCTGAERYEGGTLWCSYKAGRLQGLNEALAVSCNMAFASLGIRVGRQALLEEYRQYGFDAGYGVPWGAAGRIKQPEGNERQLADLAIGLEATDITPLHAALIAVPFANGGVLPEPRLVVASDGVLGVSPRELPRRPGRQILEPAWLPPVREAMEAVVWGGTATGVAPRGFRVAMKTGTAAEWRRGYHVNYIGFGPLPKPQIAFCVRITHQSSSGRVNRVAREVTRALLAGLESRFRVPGAARPPITP
jgi:peptidoglycan glycosyltransferase